MYTQEVVSDKNNGCFLSKMVTMSFVTEILRYLIIQWNVLRIVDMSDCKDIIFLD